MKQSDRLDDSTARSGCKWCGAARGVVIALCLATIVWTLIALYVWARTAHGNPDLGFLNGFHHPQLSGNCVLWRWAGLAIIVFRH